MKTRNLAFKILAIAMICVGFVLICVGMAGCGKDEPKSDSNNNSRNNLAKYNYIDKMPHVVGNILGLKFCEEEYYATNTMTLRTFGLAFREDNLNQKSLSYKLYKVEEGRLSDTGQTMQFSVADIMKMWFGNFVFYENHDLEIVSCVYPVSGTYTTQLKLTYKYEYPNITVDYSNLPEGNYNPVLSLKPWIESTDDYCIIAFENENVKQAMLNAIDYFKKNNPHPVKFEAWRTPKLNNNTPYITFSPDMKWCYYFMKNCLVPLTNKLNPKEQIIMDDEYEQSRLHGIDGYDTDFVFTTLYAFIPDKQQ